MKYADDKDSFVLNCLGFLLENDDLSIWFDTINNFPRQITYEKTCDQQWNAFQAVHDDPDTHDSDVSEYLGASYLASLSLNLDSSLRTDYDECINKQVVDEPNIWATEFVAAHPIFQLWSQEDMMLASADAATAVVNACEDACPNDGTCAGLCDGCLIGINQFYLAYGAYLDKLNEEVEGKYWKQLETSFSSVNL